MNMFRTNFLISKHDDSSETRLLILEQSGFPIHQSLSILSGERFEIRANLEWPLPLQQQAHNANQFPFPFQMGGGNDINVNDFAFQEGDVGDENANLFPFQMGGGNNANANPFPFQVGGDNANLFPFTPPIFILGSASVNGTLCLYRGLTTVLWNPATAEFKIIPASLQPKENIEFNLPPHGFGYDCVTDDFKVIRKVTYPLEFEGDDWVCLPDKDDPFWETDIHHLDMNDAYWVEKGLIVKLYEPFWEMYSLKRDSWRKLDGFDDMPVSYPGIMSMVNLNGFCHWLTQGPDVVSFDFSKETFVATTLPSSDVRHRSYSFALVELNESLSVIYNYDRTPDFHIWVLGEVGVKESWTKLFVFGPYNCSIVCPISVGNKNRIFFREEDSKLGWYDLSTQRVEVIGVNKESFCSHMVIYKENLLPFPRMNNFS